MQVKLIPSPESGLEEIIINEQVFSVGRHHTPFESYPPAIVNRLSRRHARIITENRQIYLIDTGSRNGTSLNGNKLDDKPVVISNGDEIGFSDKLIYRVAVEDPQNQDSTVLASDAEIHLTLIPDEADLAPIVITRFPFLISKTDRAFSGYPEDYTQDIRYISRKHAYFDAKNTDIYIEDLGSTNGTFVNDTRLSEHRLLLKAGDRIGFGGKRLIYTVHIEIEYPVKDSATEIQGNDDETRIHEVFDEQKTTFVANPNSFLEIFCAGQEEDPDTPGNEQSVPDPDPPTKNPKPAKTAVGRFYRQASIFLRQAREVLAEDSTNTKRSRIVAALFALIVAVGVAFYWSGATKRDIQEALEQANFGRSLDLANEYLQKYPEDKEVGRIAIESMLKYRVPQWIVFIRNKKYQNAQELLDEAANEDTGNIEENKNLIAVLDQIGKLEQYIESRIGIGDKLVIFQDEQPINDLLDWWENEEFYHKKTMQTIANTVPQFKPISERTVSNLRKLKSDRSSYLDAMEQLKSTIAEKLNDHRTDELESRLDAFENKYPKIQGTDRIRKDLQYFRELESQIERRNLREIRDFLAENPLTTPPFREYIDQNAKTLLPPQTFWDAFLQSSDAWRSGNTDVAIEILEELNNNDWNNFSATEFDRKKNIRDRYRELEGKQGTQNYSFELLDFYSLLDQNEDIYFLDQIKPKFEEQKTVITAEAEREMRLAKSAWQLYESGGKISYLQRLENYLSNDFKKLAILLSKTYSHADRGMRFYERAGVELPPDSAKLYDQILSETRLQRRSMIDLKTALDFSTFKAKIALLPTPPDASTTDPIEP